MEAYQGIHQALTQSVIDLNLGVPLAYENSDFDPKTNNEQQFVVVTSLLNDQTSLNKTLTDEVTGIYQLSVYTRSGKGTADAIGLVDSIIGYYKHNLNIVNGSQTVVIVNSGRNTGRNSGGWYIIDVSVSFKSDIAR